MRPSSPALAMFRAVPCAMSLPTCKVAELCYTVGMITWGALTIVLLVAFVFWFFNTPNNS